MKRTVIAALVSSTLTVGAVAQNGQNGAAVGNHRPNEYTLACLEAPTRDCAFSSALQTVIAEDFGIERSKVLVAVARAMIATGQAQEAIETLMLALDEARSVNLSLVTQEKITEIAPLLARANDTASALALVQEIQIGSVRERTLIDIARENMVAGRIADANVALGQMASPTRAFWQRLRLLPLAPTSAVATVDVSALEAQVREFTQTSQLYRGLVLLAVLSDRKGEPADRQGYLMEADELFSGLIGLNERALATAHRLRAMYDGQMDDALLDESYALFLLHSGRVRSIETQMSIAEIIGVVEADRGGLEAAVKRMTFFPEVADKARYLSSLRSVADEGSLAAEIRMMLAEVAELEGVYERDLVRLQLLEGALANNDLALARRVIASIEDDDNQARGLALAAPLLE